MGHRDFSTTLIYADYLPAPKRERIWTERAFGDEIADDEAGRPWPALEERFDDAA